MSDKLTCEEILPSVFLFRAPTQYHLASAFIRLQEFYESPYEDIRGKSFSLMKYMDLYAEDHNGKFTYFTDWNGFNVPGDVVRDFFDLFGESGLSSKECFIKYSLFHQNKVGQEKPFYIIGVHDQKPATMDHEIAHALYSTNPTYKNTVDDIIFFDFPDECIDAFFQKLLDMGYCKEVLQDETQAYLATSSFEYLQEKFPDIDLPLIDLYIIREVFEKHKRGE